MSTSSAIDGRTRTTTRMRTARLGEVAFGGRLKDEERLDVVSLEEGAGILAE